MPVSYHKLTLGTVQFGLDYGLNNVHGQVAYPEVVKIIDLAAKNGIITLDTASAYGESERVVGKYLQQTNDSFKVISKIKTANLDEAKKIFNEALVKLGRSYLDGYLIHRFDEYRQSPEIYEYLLEQKAQGKIRKLGFSLYFPHELEYLFAHQVPFDIVQFPYSILDRRFEPYLTQLADQQIEMYVRSVFLQGILLKDPLTLPAHFDSVKAKLMAMHQLADQVNLPMLAITLGFAHRPPEITGIVIGVHTTEQLQKNLDAVVYFSEVAKVLPQFDQFEERDERITVPLHWPV